MLGVMASTRPDKGAPPGARAAATRRGPLIVEIVALVLLTIVDSVPLFGGRPTHGMTAVLLTSIVPGFGSTAAVLAVLRRRFVARIGLLSAGVIAISLVNTGLSGLAHSSHGTPGLTETLAIALLVGAGCRRLDRYPAIGLGVAGGVAMTVAPVLRYGVGSSMALLAVPAALLWGGSLAIGLTLRDTDESMANWAYLRRITPTGADTGAIMSGLRYVRRRVGKGRSWVTDHSRAGHTATRTAGSACGSGSPVWRRSSSSYRSPLSPPWWTPSGGR